MVTLLTGSEIAHTHWPNLVHFSEIATRVRPFGPVRLDYNSQVSAKLREFHGHPNSILLIVCGRPLWPDVLFWSSMHPCNHHQQGWANHHYSMHHWDIIASIGQLYKTHWSILKKYPNKGISDIPIWRSTAFWNATFPINQEHLPEQYHVWMPHESHLSMTLLKPVSVTVRWSSRIITPWISLTIIRQDLGWNSRGPTIKQLCHYI